jgi:pyruvate formate lyase activating enzyme
VSWRDSFRPARLEERLEDGRVRCHLSPRNCEIAEGRQGFCGVRGNRGGRLVTFNYGKGVHPTRESIETEAVNHFAPGEPILSLGNVGCMLACDYCHNWKTSQARHVDDRDVFELSPEEIVETARRHGIRVISWTYNDPVVWHELVLDASRLAKAAGMTTLFKSAFFITPEAVEELLPVIDIFSVSIKSLDPAYYRRLTKGWLEPVLEATKQVHRAGKHLEVSTLMVTDVSDDEKTARDVAGWVLRELDARVPLHVVRYHPDYRMSAGERTPVDRIVRARTIAREMGVEHVYAGNVHDETLTSTDCRGCGARLVTRWGLDARVEGLDAAGRCRGCGRDAHVTLLPPRAPEPRVDEVVGVPVHRFAWHGDIRSLHVQVENRAQAPRAIHWRRAEGPWTEIRLAPGERWRFLLAKSAPEETGVEIAIPDDVSSNLHEVLDRAHFPTVALDPKPARLPVHG